MLFNLDKISKHNILEQYKQAALDYKQKKQKEKERRIKEEKEYIEELERKQKQTDIILKQEKLKRQNEEMKEYKIMIKNLNYDKPGFHYKHRNNDDITNKNWGKNNLYSGIPKNIKKAENNHISKNLEIFNNNSYLSTPKRKMSPSQKEREYVRKEDSIGKFFSDIPNLEEFERYMNEQKEKRQKYYREILDSQYNEIQNKNKNLYGTIDPVIIRRERRNILTENPYVKKTNYYFGKSTLSHNPITNPENNVYYNKYLFNKNNLGGNLSNNYIGNTNSNDYGHIFNNDINQFKEIENPNNNFGLNNSKSCRNIFRNNSYSIFGKKQNNINNNPNIDINFNKYDNNNMNLHSNQTPSNSRNILKKAGSSSFFF